MQKNVICLKTANKFAMSFILHLGLWDLSLNKFIDCRNNLSGNCFHLCVFFPDIMDGYYAAVKSDAMLCISE